MSREIQDDNTLEAATDTLQDDGTGSPDRADDGSSPPDLSSAASDTLQDDGTG